MKYQRSITLGCKDIGDRKSEFLTTTQKPSFLIVESNSKPVNHNDITLTMSGLTLNVKVLNEGIQTPCPAYRNGIIDTLSLE